jgi:hypothetical protein
MFAKLLITLAVIFAAYLATRTRARQETVRHASASEPSRGPSPMVRAAAYALAVVMIGGSAAWLLWDWEAGREVVSVRVINTNTGQSTLYRVRSAELHGSERGFTTLDGRRVILAPVDRMVVEDPR